MHRRAQGVAIIYHHHAQVVLSIGGHGLDDYGFHGRPM